MSSGRRSVATAAFTVAVAGAALVFGPIGGALMLIVGLAVAAAALRPEIRQYMARLRLRERKDLLVAIAPIIVWSGFLAYAIWLTYGSDIAYFVADGAPADVRPITVPPATTVSAYSGELVAMQADEIFTSSYKGKYLQPTLTISQISNNGRIGGIIVQGATPDGTRILMRFPYAARHDLSHLGIGDSITSLCTIDSGGRESLSLDNCRIVD
jgi:hypothetical protein